MNINIDSLVKHKYRPYLNEGGWFDVVDVDQLSETALCIFEDEFGTPQQQVFNFEELKLNSVQHPIKPSLFYTWEIT